MSKNKEEDASPNLPTNTNSNNSLTVKDYLETATEASRRTRFFTIVMVVASVLILVSVLNSSDIGWITLRINALGNKTSAYTTRKFPLLCKCEKKVEDAQLVLCTDLEAKPKNSHLFSEINEIGPKINQINNELVNLKAAAYEVDDAQKAKVKESIEIKEKEVEKLEERKKNICKEETDKLNRFYESMLRSAAETKYTVRVPFFGVAFDINDVGILGGFGLWVVLILLRLSLRSQIVSLRIGFKVAFERNQETDFYQILAARQVFVFPPLNDEKQEVAQMQGWIEKRWRASKLGMFYHRKDNDNVNKWRANRNITLRIVPKVLSLLPFGVYLIQFTNDLLSLQYGHELSTFRTWTLVIWSSFILLNTLIFGVWCITKWNEIDKLWDYYNKLEREKESINAVNDEASATPGE
jgi:hypothetical protein